MIYPVYNSRSFPNGKCDYYEFHENGYCQYRNYEDDIVKEGKIYVSKSGETYKGSEFHRWCKVDCEIIDIDDKKYVKLIISYHPDYDILNKHVGEFILLKTDAKKIVKVFDNRNKEVDKAKTEISSKIDEEILEIAQNFTCIINEDYFLDDRIISYFCKHYSHVLMNSDTYSDFKEEFKDDFYLKGKAKKEVQKYNSELRKKINEIAEVLDNFVEIIIEEKGLKDYVAKAVAWAAIEQKLIEYYTNKWQEEYATRIDLEYEELNHNLSDATKEAKENEYIIAVFMSQKIDITDIEELLFYFLMSKKELQEISLFDYLEQFYEKIRDIKEKIATQRIKNKLKTKQKRIIKKYTITDIDLMTGTEFEEFISLLFNKMGYSSKVTQKSGDQGIDVIANRNGIKIGIQTKCYSGAVGNSAVQEVIAGKMFYKCDKALVITNSYFTPAAIELAKSSNIILWDREMLKEKIAEFM